MSATFNKFNATSQNLMQGKMNLNSDTIKVMLSNVAPSATNAVFADLTEISAGNGYSAGGATIGSTSATQTSGVCPLAGADAAITASGGSVGPFRYVCLYDNTPVSPAKPLLGYWDYGSSVTLGDGGVFTISPTGGKYLQLS